MTRNDPTIYVVGNDEDGGFVRTYDSIEDLRTWLGRMTTGEPDRIDLSELTYDEDALYFDVPVYHGNMITFAIIEGNVRTIEAKEIATDIELT